MKYRLIDEEGFLSNCGENKGLLESHLSACGTFTLTHIKTSDDGLSRGFITPLVMTVINHDEWRYFEKVEEEGAEAVMVPPEKSTLEAVFYTSNKDTIERLTYACKKRGLTMKTKVNTEGLSSVYISGFKDLQEGADFKKLFMYDTL